MTRGHRAMLDTARVELDYYARLRAGDPSALAQRPIRLPRAIWGTAGGAGHGGPAFMTSAEAFSLDIARAATALGLRVDHVCEVCGVLFDAPHRREGFGRSVCAPCAERSDLAARARRPIGNHSPLAFPCPGCVLVLLTDGTWPRYLVPGRRFTCCGAHGKRWQRHRNAGGRARITDEAIEFYEVGSGEPAVIAASSPPLSAWLRTRLVT